MVYRVSCPVKLPDQLCHETFLTGSCTGWTTRLDAGPHRAKLESPSRGPQGLFAMLYILRVSINTAYVYERDQRITCCSHERVGCPDDLPVIYPFPSPYFF
jgi:hypothetical protein